MAVRILRMPEPLSDKARDGSSASTTAIVQSTASRILKQELRRYCVGEINGRSFLVAGHRGAGKTTTVADAIESIARVASSAALPMRPLPVFLHGPSLFETRPTDVRKAKSARAAAGGSASTVHDTALDEAEEAELRAEVALTQILLGLHRAALHEYAVAYRQLVCKPVLPGTDTRFEEGGELAAQFEIELAENPPASRLRQFWSEADALTTGILFPLGRGQPTFTPSGIDQGARELVALNGLCNAHQRISGELSGTDTDSSSSNQERQTSVGIDGRLADALKPASAVLSGAAVAGGTLVGTQSIAGAAVLGLLTAIASSFAFKRVRSTTSKRERQVDKKFIPDLSVKTLDRIMQTLVRRLREAGLAPVLVIDELDKVTGLSARMDSIVGDLKKLVAEEVFACFLTDRGYLEQLQLSEQRKAYGIRSSFFSYPLLIVHEPVDLAVYLDAILDTSPGNTADDVADKKVLMWVLRHRSQMHALRLARELVSLRSDAGELCLPPRTVRDAKVYQIDATFQVAIEYHLSDSELVGWSAQRPNMRQTLFDAIYYISRHWLNGHETLVFDDALKTDFTDTLHRRMNMAEVCSSGDRKFEAEERLAPEDVDRLYRVVKDMAVFLSDESMVDINGTLIAATLEKLKNWPADALGQSAASTLSRPDQTVLDVLLVGPHSLLVRIAGNDKVDRFAFRFSRSGEALRTTPIVAVDPTPGGIAVAPGDDPAAAVAPTRSRTAAEIHAAAKGDLDYLRTFDLSICQMLQLPTDPLGAGYKLLCDDTRVLPLTPSWRGALDAYAQLREASFSAGNPSDLEQHLLRLVAFIEMLKTNVVAVGPALASAAFLAGLRGSSSQSDDRGAVPRALVLLSHGLRFERLSTSDVITAVNEFVRQMSSVVKVFPGAPVIDVETGVVEPWSAGAVDTAVLSGRNEMATLDWKALTTQRWRAIATRLRSLTTGQSPGIASVAEILCAAREETEGRLIGLSPAASTIQVWSDLAQRAWWSWIAESPPSSSVPGEVLPYALALCGLARTDRGIIDALASIRSTDPAFSWTEFEASLPGRRESPVAATTIVLVRSTSRSISEAWTERPTRSLVFVVSGSDYLAMRKPGNSVSILDSLNPPMIIAFEHGCGVAPPDREPTKEQMGQSIELKSFNPNTPPWNRNELLATARGADEFCTLISLPTSAPA